MKTSEYIRRNALIYERYKDNFDHIEWVELNQFRLEVEQAFNNIPCKVLYVTGQPYENVEQLTNGIKTANLLRVSEDFNDSRLLPGELNLKFRAVHDYLHYVLQQPFTAEGEIKVYKLQKRLHCSAIGKRILFSEVVLQACYAEYFGVFAPQQKVILYTGETLN